MAIFRTPMTRQDRISAINPKTFVASRCFDVRRSTNLESGCRSCGSLSRELAIATLASCNAPELVGVAILCGAVGILALLDQVKERRQRQQR